MLNKQAQDSLNGFAKYVIQQSRSNLTKGGKKASGDLYNSLGYNVEQTAKGFSLSFEMEDYGTFQDLGVKGKSKQDKAPNSPYRFGTGSGKKGGLTKGIDKWVRRKGIQFRDKKSGRFLSYDSTAFIIFTKPFTKAFKRLPDELVKAYSIGLEKQIQVNINKK